MDNTQETQSETVIPEETTEQSDLDIARERAQQEVDAFQTVVTATTANSHNHKSKS